ncbi:unnamed protein product [Camellia sinensis]
MKTGVLEIYYCPCQGCNKILVELGKFLEVQQIDRDAEKHKASILVTGDPYKVTKALKRDGKRFEYFERTLAMNKVTNALKKHGKKFEYFEKSPPMNNLEMRLVIPQKLFQVVARPPGYGFTGIPLEDLEIDETIVKKTRVCCPKCNHELELKRYNKWFACDGCKRTGLDQDTDVRTVTIAYTRSARLLNLPFRLTFSKELPLNFVINHAQHVQGPCYACGKAICGYFYRCKSKELDLHTYCSNLKRNLYGMDFVYHYNEISSSSKCVCCEKKMRWGEQKRYGMTPLKKPVDLQRLNELVSIGSGPNSGKLVIMFMQLGAKLPLYAFKRVNKIVGEKGLIALDYIEPSIAFLDSLLLGEWEDRMQRGLFRYDVTACETKVIPGEYGFIAQLNEGRHLKKRPTEFRVDKVLQPFDGNKFNFTKVGQEEVLFQFEASDEDNETQFFPNAPIDVENSPSVVAINVSPIEYGHVLLIPWILECLPQRIDRVSFLLALYMAAEAGNPYFRLGYNSLGAFATINHLHFQCSNSLAYYLAVPFPIEKAPIREITTLNGEVKISELLNYPVRGLVFEGGNTLEDLSNAVSDSCICLQDNNVPYNVPKATVPDSDYWWFCFQEIMHDPQVAADGFTYEGDALRGWLENGRETSPMTNLRLDHLHLTPNHALRLAIQDWLCKV